jgi:hypothetical protein
MDKRSEGFSAILVILIIFVILVTAGIIFYLRLPSNQTTANITPTMANQNGNPTIKVTDMAPNLPDSKKTGVLIKHADSTYEKLVLPTENVNAYVSNLPEGDTIVGKIPTNK